MAKYEEWVAGGATPAQSVQTTTGPTTLTVGAVADGEYLKRSGSTVVGGTPYGMFPVGSVFWTDSNTNPNTLLGYGTWTSLGSGSVIIGMGTATLYCWHRTA